MKKYFIEMIAHDTIKKKYVLFKMEHESESAYYFRNQEIQDIISYFEFYGFVIYCAVYRDLNQTKFEYYVPLSDSLSLKKFKNQKEKNNVHLQRNH